MYSAQDLDGSSPQGRALCYQEWIIRCWRELPFTTSRDDRLALVFDYHELPNLPGLYAVSALLHPHHLDLPLVYRWSRPFKISEYLPDWVDPNQVGAGYEQLLYIGQTGNLFKRWWGHNKMNDFYRFLNHGIEMKFRFYAEPPFMQDSQRFVMEKSLILTLQPLLNFHGFQSE